MFEMILSKKKKTIYSLYLVNIHIRLLSTSNNCPSKMTFSSNASIMSHSDNIN